MEIVSSFLPVPTLLTCTISRHKSLYKGKGARCIVKDNIFSQLIYKKKKEEEEEISGRNVPIIKHQSG